MANDTFTKTDERMNNSIEAFQREIAKLRTGRASLSILDNLRVDYYGSQTPLSQMATLGVPDPRTLTIQAWDASAMQSIEKAIQNSGLGLNPVNDGTLIRINIPTLSEERRCDLVKIVKKHGEDCKVSIRNARRDANEEIKQAKKTSAITEDDERNNLEEIQKTTDAYIKKIDEAVKQKEQDIMKV